MSKTFRSRLSRTIATFAGLALFTGTGHAQGAKPLTKCAPDAAVSGTVCMDKYEATVWRISNPLTTNKSLVKKIQQGKATEADLIEGGATRLSSFYNPCALNGQNCIDDIYAVSLPNVLPSRGATWFQAQVACENSRKRLPTNAEWQAAVTGTPDAGPDDGVTDCNTATAAALLATGSRASCKSARGCFDMVGNLSEFVADWVPRSTGCGTWTSFSSPTGDDQCLSGAATAGEPGSVLRGGNYYTGFGGGTDAGPLAVVGTLELYRFESLNGFRCAR